MRPWLPEPQYRHVTSHAFLRSPEWLAVRRDAIRLNDGRCECCRRPFGPGVPLNVDHIYPRARFPHLALERRNLQCLCGGPDGCNARKCNDIADYRSRWHPHRITWWRRLWRWIKRKGER